MSLRLLALALLALVLSLGCPTRPNPALLDGSDGDVQGDDADTDGDGDVDADADTDAGTDVDGDADAEQDAALPDGAPDSGRCDPGFLECGDDCVPVDSSDSCGACGVACAALSGCNCRRSNLLCEDRTGRACYDACSLGQLYCPGGDGFECLDPSLPEHCGGCDLVCESDEACECRETGTLGIFQCLRRESGAGGAWVDCSTTSG